MINDSGTKGNSLVSRTLKLFSLIALIYGVLTFGSWYYLSQQVLCNPKHGKLELSFTGKSEISAHTISPGPSHIGTRMTGGFPILFQVQSMKFKDGHGSVGTARITHRLNSVIVRLDYDPPLPQPTIIPFSKCI